MKKVMYRINILLLFIVITSYFMSCEKEVTPSLFDPDKPSKPTPVITDIIPHGSAYAVIEEVTIKGSNFSSTPDENLVFFDGSKAKVTTASATQLTIITPNVTGDSLEVKIAVLGAELYSEPVFYKLKPSVSTIGTFLETETEGYAVAVDLDENVYVSLTGKLIKKITPEDVTTTLASVSFLTPNGGMKMGPGYTLYAAFSAGRVRKIATISPDGNEGTYVTLPGAPQDFDFDADGNIWISVDKDIYLIKPDASPTQIKTFSLPLKTVRVFDGYLYISGMDEATGEAKIWRSQIQGETLGTEEEVLDLTAAWLNNSTINSFTFSEDGEMYIATDNLDAIFTYNPVDGSHKTLYPGLIGPKIIAFCWGEGQDIYALQQLSGSFNVLKIVIRKNGAPYYGRKP